MISLGCDKNRVDGERLLGEIKRRGCEIVNDLSEAEVLIVNTCAFLNAAREESINAVLEGNSYRGGKLEKIVVSGCLPQKYVEELFPALTEADVFLGISDVPALFDALEKSYAGERVNAVGSCSGELLSERLVSTAPHVKYLKIADGCFNRCTYSQDSREVPFFPHGRACRRGALAGRNGGADSRRAGYHPLRRGQRRKFICKFNHKNI